MIPFKNLRDVQIVDNGERCVNIKEACPDIRIRIHPVSKELQNLPDNVCHLRKGAIKRLCAAQRSLPEGLFLMVFEGHRPLPVQKRMFQDYYQDLEMKNPTWSKERLKRETSKFVAPVEDVPPHLTGGAVDLTLVDGNDTQLYMGTRYLEFSERTRTHYKDISNIEKKNRDILIGVMQKAGFVNYPLEWWHWSFGDRYWALILNKKFSIYGPYEVLSTLNNGSK
jgi:D-alanyl-D-alanine dipeptidase